MGFKQLANGWEYYSISEELKIFSEELYGFLGSISAGWFLTIFVTFMVLFVVYVAIYGYVFVSEMNKSD